MTSTAHLCRYGLTLTLLYSLRLYWLSYFSALLDFYSDRHRPSLRDNGVCSSIYRERLDTYRARSAIIKDTAGSRKKGPTPLMVRHRGPLARRRWSSGAIRHACHALGKSHSIEETANVRSQVLSKLAWALRSFASLARRISNGLFCVKRRVMHCSLPVHFNERRDNGPPLETVLFTCGHTGRQFATFSRTIHTVS